MKHPFYDASFLSNKQEHYIKVPISAIPAMANALLIAGFLLWNIAIAKGRKLAA